MGKPVDTVHTKLEAGLYDSPTFEEIIIQKYKVAIIRHMTKEMGDMMRSSMKFDKYYNEVMGNMVYQLSAYVAGNEVHKTEHGEYETKQLPATWWDALKVEKSWIQKILGKPKYKDFIYKVKNIYSHTHMCPHVNVPFNRDMGIHLKFMSESDHDLEEWTGVICDICGEPNVPKKDPMCARCYYEMRYS